MAVGFASVFNDKNMGETWFIEPEPEVRLRYEVFYALVRLLVENKSITPPTTAEIPAGETTVPSAGGKSKIPLRLPDLPMQELGPQE